MAPVGRALIGDSVLHVAALNVSVSYYYGLLVRTSLRARFTTQSYRLSGKQKHNKASFLRQKHHKFSPKILGFSKIFAIFLQYLLRFEANRSTPPKATPIL
jgi:hypothetical protein